jgi:hypothetical protein
MAADNILVNGREDDPVRPKKPCSLITIADLVWSRRQ